MKDCEGQGQEGGRDEVERETEERDEGEGEIGKCDETVMQRDCAFPRQAAEQRAALIFLVVGEGGEIDDEEIREREHGQRDEEDGQQARVFPGLEEKADGWNDVGDVQGEDQLTEAPIGKVEGRDGVGEDEDDGRKQEEKSGQGQGEVEMDNEGDDGVCGDHADGNIQQVVAKDLFLPGGFACDERFVVRTENFAQECHARLRQQDASQPEGKDHRLEGFSQIGGDACAEEVRQRGEEEVERAGEAEHGRIRDWRILDFRLTI